MLQSLQILRRQCRDRRNLCMLQLKHLREHLNVPPIGLQLDHLRVGVDAGRPLQDVPLGIAFAREADVPRTLYFELLLRDALKLNQVMTCGDKNEIITMAQTPQTIVIKHCSACCT